MTAGHTCVLNSVALLTETGAIPRVRLSSRDHSQWLLQPARNWPRFYAPLLASPVVPVTHSAPAAPGDLADASTHRNGPASGHLHLHPLCLERSTEGSIMASNSRSNAGPTSLPCVAHVLPPLTRPTRCVLDSLSPLFGVCLLHSPARMSILVCSVLRN